MTSHDISDVILHHRKHLKKNGYLWMRQKPRNQRKKLKKVLKYSNILLCICCKEYMSFQAPPTRTILSQDETDGSAPFGVQLQNAGCKPPVAKPTSDNKKTEFQNFKLRKTASTEGEKKSSSTKGTQDFGVKLKVNYLSINLLLSINNVHICPLVYCYSSIMYTYVHQYIVIHP